MALHNPTDTATSDMQVTKDIEDDGVEPLFISPVTSSFSAIAEDDKESEEDDQFPEANTTQRSHPQHQFVFHLLICCLPNLLEKVGNGYIWQKQHELHTAAVPI
jgi:hypothetical protein